MQENKKFPGILQSIILLIFGIIITLLISSLIGGIVGGYFGAMFQDSGMSVAEIKDAVSDKINSYMSYITIIGYLISNSILVLIAIRKRKDNLKTILFKNTGKIKFKLLGILALISVSFAFFFAEIMSIIIYIFEIPASEFENISRVMKGIPGIILGLVLAPFFEEILFRGIILDGIASKRSAKIALITSSLLFAIYHLNLLQSIPAFFVSLFFGFIYLKTGSVLLCIFSHSLYNLVPVIFTQFSGESSTSNLYFSIIDIFIIVISLLILTTGYKMFKNYLNNYLNDDTEKTTFIN